MKKGFTLIELLVVISIIGILAALTLTGFNAARKNARDAQRKSDLQQYRVALEGYFSNNGKYPAAQGGGNNQDWIAGDGSLYPQTGIFSSGGPIIGNDKYLPSAIKPPLAVDLGGRDVYRYWYNSGAVNWKLSTGLETGGDWEICSDGRAGKPAAITADSTCNL